jgi:hypothetical protein
LIPRMISVQSRSSQAGATLAEVLIAATVCAVFFVGVFEVNALCLRLINASKEGVAAIECVQDRLEQLRNLSYGTLVDTAGVTALLTTPPNPSTLPLKARETVTISKFADGATTNPSVTFTRTPGTNVVPTPSPGAIDFTGVKLVQVDVTYDWTTTLGAIGHQESASTIISDGAKK